VATRSSNAIVLRTQSTPARRRSSPKTSKKHEALKRRLSALRKRAGGAINSNTTQQLVTVGTPVALQLLKARGIELPTLGGINPMLMYGALFTLVAPTVFKGETGRYLVSAGLGMAAVGASQAAEAGSVMVAGGKKSRSKVGDDELGDDELGDDELGDDELGDDELGDDELGDDED
jgi:hypothetical protein